MATGTTKAPAYNAEASSTEVMELVPGKIKATFAGDIYIKSETEQNFFCNVKHLTCLDKNKIVVVDDAVSTESRFAFSSPEPGKFRVKLVDTTLKQVVSVLDVPGKFSGMTNIGDTRLAVCVDGDKIVLLRADKILTAERPLKLRSQYEMTHLSTFKDSIYTCSGRTISTVDMMGKTAQVFQSTDILEIVPGPTSRSRKYTSQEIISSAMYECGDKTFMYAITVDKTRDWKHTLGHGQPYLAHGTGKVGVMDKTTTLEPGEPRSIVIDDEFELLFVLIFVEQQPYSIARRTGEHYVIYILRPGTTDGCVLLGEDDGLQDVTSMAYWSKARKLFVGSTENNYVKVYQLSSVP